MPPDHTRWANQQVNAAIGIGINPIDAQRAVQWVLDNLPPGADPATYTFPADAMEQDISDPRFRDDARVAWYGNEDIPAAYKRLLDAGEQSE